MTNSSGSHMTTCLTSIASAKWHEKQPTRTHLAQHVVVLLTINRRKHGRTIDASTLSDRSCGKAPVSS